MCVCEQMGDALVAGAPERDVVCSTEVIEGLDGTKIELYISKPKGQTDGLPMPCIFHCHGGTPAALGPENGIFSYLRDR
jgi:hypothetical protein